ncbi:MAG: hypothetical protein J6W64_06990 [Bacilli bacterium]|nr:hypothetical protein [Bacilli bacterium]
MKYFFIVLTIIIILILVRIIIKIKSDKDIFNLLNKYSDKYTLVKAHKKAYQYVLRTDDLDIYVCVLKIPPHSQICINAKETWKLSYNTFKKDKGSGYSASRYLSEIEYFLKNDINTNKNYLKLILVYKDTEEIVRYLNETELDVIDFSKTPYGYKITTYTNFSRDLDILLKK